METKFQTSFIPKQPLNEPVHQSSSSGILFLVSFLIFVASVASAGGVFLYGKYLNQSITTGNDQLKKNKNAFDPNTIQELSRLSDRLNAVNGLLQQHIAVSNIFSVIGDATLKNVRYNDFTYTYVGDGKVTISMKGQATSYETVALQSHEYTNPSLRNVFKSPIVGDLSPDNNGNVGFSFTSGLDPALLSYYKSVKSQANQDVVTPTDTKQ